MDAAAVDSPTTAHFVQPRWDTPLDTAERLAKIPENATVKGMFFTGALTVAKRVTGQQIGRGHYIAFKDYPLTEHIHVLEECARLAYPGAAPREGLRQLGRDAYSTFAESMAGKTLFGIAARNWDAGLRLISRAYTITGPVGVGNVVESTSTHAIITLRGIWNFPDSYHVGVFEAAMKQWGKKGSVWVHVLGLADVDLELRLSHELAAS